MSKSILDHIKNGTYRPGRHAGKGVKESLPEPPRPPADLPESMRKIWENEVKTLFESTSIAEKDLPALRELVTQLHYMQLAAADLERNGLTITANLKAGPKVVQNPAFRVFQDCQRVVMQYRQQFGLTPMSGQKMTMPPPQRPDPLDTFN